MRKIRMLRTEKGSNDGINLMIYQEGEVYPKPFFQIGDELMSAFVAAGIAEEVAEPVAVSEPVAAEAEPAVTEAKARKGRKK